MTIGVTGEEVMSGKVLGGRLSSPSHPMDGPSSKLAYCNLPKSLYSTLALSQLSQKEGKGDKGKWLIRPSQSGWTIKGIELCLRFRTEMDFS
jgi:hypothetical protein